MSPNFDLTQSRSDDTVVITLRGEIDMATAPILSQAADAAVRAPDVVRLVLDMDGVTFIDSTGIGVLVKVRDNAMINGTRLVLRAMPLAVGRVLEFVALDGAFDLQPPP